jgi:hypothetical protein
MRPDTDKLLADASAVVANAEAGPVEQLQACELLVRHGILEPVLPVLRTLASDAKYAGSARLLLHTAHYMKRRGLVNDLKSVLADSKGRKAAVGDAAYWRSPDPERARRNLLIVFTGQDKNFWISLDLLHRIFRNMVGQTLYLRDFAAVCFLAGVDPYRNYESTLDHLRGMIQRAETQKVYTLGISAGGFAALKYGLDLSVDAVLALSPQTNLQPLMRSPRTAERFKRHGIPDEVLDLLPFYEQAERRPDVTIVYGGTNEGDGRHAQRMSHIPGIRLVSIPNLAMHASVPHLLATGRFEALVGEMLTR